MSRSVRIVVTGVNVAFAMGNFVVNGVAIGLTLGVVFAMSTWFIWQ